MCLGIDPQSLYFNVEETDNTGMICLPSISHGSGSQLNQHHILLIGAEMRTCVVFIKG